MTERLYYNDSRLREFDASVVRSEPRGDGTDQPADLLQGGVMHLHAGKSNRESAANTASHLAAVLPNIPANAVTHARGGH